MPPLRSAELHRVARQELGPTLQTLGFRRGSSATAGWNRREGDRWLVIWLQPYRSVAPSSDARFTLELRLSTKPETGGDGPRRRLPALLTDGQRNEIARRTIGSDEDRWFRSANEVDLRELLDFCARALPGAIDRFLEDAAAGRPT